MVESGWFMLLGRVSGFGFWIRLGIETVRSRIISPREDGETGVEGELCMQGKI